MGTNPNLSNKKFDLRQFLHNVKEFDLFEKNVNLHGLDMRDTYTNSIIKVHYISYYNVYKLYILIVKSFIYTKT